ERPTTELKYWTPRTRGPRSPGGTRYEPVLAPAARSRDSASPVRTYRRYASSPRVAFSPARSISARRSSNSFSVRALLATAMDVSVVQLPRKPDPPVYLRA